MLADILVDKVPHRLIHDVLVLLEDEFASVIQLSNEILKQLHRSLVFLGRAITDFLEDLQRDFAVIWAELVSLRPAKSAIHVALVDH